MKIKLSENKINKTHGALTNVWQSIGSRRKPLCKFQENQEVRIRVRRTLCPRGTNCFHPTL